MSTGNAGRIFFAEKRGFCSGVRRAVGLVGEAVRTGPFPVRVLHEIVHNDDVVREFAALGVEFYEEPDPSWRGGTLILSAHGVGKALEEQVSAMPVKVIDATCPLVKRLQAVAVSLEAEGYAILLAGKRDHRETEGVIGRLKNPPAVLENPEEARAFVPPSGRRCAVISQTTLSVDDYEEILEILKKKIPDLKISGGICQATTARQQAVKDLARKCRRILVIGSMKSSNSRRLCEVARSCGAEALLIPDESALPDAFLRTPGDVGIASGASAPERLVEKLTEKLEANGWISSARPPESSSADQTDGEFPVSAGR